MKLFISLVYFITSLNVFGVFDKWCFVKQMQCCKAEQKNLNCWRWGIIFLNLWMGGVKLSEIHQAARTYFYIIRNCKKFTLIYWRFLVSYLSMSFQKDFACMPFVNVWHFIHAFTSLILKLEITVHSSFYS